MKNYLIVAISMLALTACEQQSSTATETDVKNETPIVVEEAVIAAVETVEVATSSDYVPSSRTGKVIFDLHCAGCHNAGNAHAATKQLAIVRGKDLAIIRQRKDLVPIYIKHVVRDGLLEMPPFRPTDINTVELDNLANYIVESAKAYQPEGAK